MAIGNIHQTGSSSVVAAQRHLLSLAQSRCVIFISPSPQHVFPFSFSCSSQCTSANCATRAQAWYAKNKLYAPSRCTSCLEAKKARDSDIWLIID